MLYVGIDPGETWCGFAALEITSNDVVRVEARTYAIDLRPKRWIGMVHDIVGMLPHSRRATIVMEDFQIRKVGHQRFNHGDTLRLIGALQYGLDCINLFTVHLEQPRDPGRREVERLYGRAFARYRMRWPTRHDKAWAHCESAWRVLGTHLMRYEPRVLERIHFLNASSPCYEWLPTGSHHPQKEYIAPAAIWT